ncbi:MAG: (deoxy)nucleoside triphosphate pyrophosphohydrolase [Myxococcales bacterium]|nr:(deoxy)nucleoside triphosphate pyrophosphohydrolase [Myxococcales bacterium]
MTVLVAAAVIRRRGAPEVLLTQRMRGAHLAGKWEFPGGKVEPDEDPRAAVARECAEECGVTIEVGELVDVTFHAYPGKSVLLLFYDAWLTSGEVQHLGVADHRWVLPSHLDDYDLPPADRPLVAKLKARGEGRCPHCAAE